MRKFELLQNAEELEPDEDLEPAEEPLAGFVEVNRTEIESRASDPSLGIVKSGSVVIAAALEVRSAEKKPPFGDPPAPRFRLATIPDGSAASIEAFVRAQVRPGATLITDGHKSYRGLTDYHLDRGTFGRPLPRTQKLFHAVKQQFDNYSPLDRAGVDKGLKNFVARGSRPSDRRVSFERLLGAALHHKPTTYCWCGRPPTASSVPE